MIMICAWCKKIINDDQNPVRSATKNGICKVCADMLKTKYKITALFDIDDIDTINNFLARKSSI